MVSECQEDLLKNSLEKEGVYTCHPKSASPFQLISNINFCLDLKDELDNI